MPRADLPQQVQHAKAQFIARFRGIETSPLAPLVDTYFEAFQRYLMAIYRVGDSITDLEALREAEDATRALRISCETLMDATTRLALERAPASPTTH